AEVLVLQFNRKENGGGQQCPPLFLCVQGREWVAVFGWGAGIAGGGVPFALCSGHDLEHR
ncbi:MAG: hypothetical protein Q8R44_16665, partial [Novosphingobium sp.]|nr:hypothetical protein [Novosphingobium sp.]